MTAMRAEEVCLVALGLVANLEWQRGAFRVGARRALARLDALAERLEAAGREMAGEGGPGAVARPEGVR
jgi:hypothetical protein